MSIKPLPKVPRLPTSITDNGGDLIKALFSQFADTFTTVNSLVGLANTESWQAPTLAGSWANSGGSYAPAGYYKDGGDVIHLRGVVKDGTGTIFTLPYGYRPAYTHTFASLANDSACRITGAADGTVVWAAGGTNAWVSLDNICFRVD